MTDQPFTSLRNRTRGVFCILARAVGTVPGGAGSADSVVRLIGGQSSESGDKFSARHFFGNSEGCDLRPHVKEGQIVDRNSGAFSFSSRNQVVGAVHGGNVVVAEVQSG